MNTFLEDERESEEDEQNERAWKEFAEAACRRALALTAAKPMTLNALVTMLRDEALLTHAETWIADNFDEDERYSRLVAEIHEILAEHGNAIWTTEGEPIWVASTTALLDSIVLTHRLEQDEIEKDAVGASPDLAVIDFDVERDEQLLFEGGGDFGWHGGDEDDPSGVYRGPKGWLSEFCAGDLLAFERRGNSISVRRIDGAEAGEAEANALRAAFDQRTGPNRSDEIPYIAIEAIAMDPSLFHNAVTPIAGLLEQVGLEHDNPHVGRAGESWERPGSFGSGVRRLEAARRYDFDPSSKQAFDTVIEALEATSEVDVTSALRALAHKDVLEAFVFSETTPGLFPISDRAIKRLQTFSNRLCECAARDEERAAALTLRGSVRELVGDIVGGGESFTEAVRIAPNDTALAGVAALATARGDAHEARTLLRRCSSTPRASRGELAMLDRLFSTFDHAGRNEPCPCGSGKKYKTCCLRRPSLSLDQREMWFLQRLITYVTSSRQSTMLTALMMAAFGFDSDSIENEDRLFLAVMALLDGDALPRYIETYGALLDDVDRELAAAWQGVTLALWEVVDLDPTTLRDTESGDTHPLVPGSQFQDLQVGMHMGYVRNTERGLQVFGPLYRLSSAEEASARELFSEPHSAVQTATWFGSHKEDEQG